MSTDDKIKDATRIVVDDVVTAESQDKLVVDTPPEQQVAPEQQPITQESATTTDALTTFPPQKMSKDDFLAVPKSFAKWAWDMRAPLLLLFMIAVAPKLIILWIFVVLAKPVTLLVYNRLPQDMRTSFEDSLPQKLKESSFRREVAEGADQGLPFLLFWLYLCFAPFALIWIFAHWVRGFMPEKHPKPESADGFVLIQNPRKDHEGSEVNFYHSKVFGIVMLAFFALGIPAFFSYGVYENLGMERIMTNPHPGRIRMDDAAVPPVKVPTVGISQTKKYRIGPDVLPSMYSGSSDAVKETVVPSYSSYWPWLRNVGLEPTKSSVFFVHFYLVSLGAAICVLLFRTWFLFPLNFLSDEHKIEFSANGIKRNSLKGWFLSVITFNGWAIGRGPDELRWDQVKSLRRLEDGFTRLYPLPETAFKKESLSYKLLNKIAALIDGVSNRHNTGRYLVFSTTESTNDFGQNIRIDLNELNPEQRARLFYSVKQWAPHVVITQSSEEQLLGSTVLRDTRYTQLWFDMLTTRTRTRRQNVLASGESLKDGKYTIDERLNSGGQATSYLATKTDGQKCVLKEFILATSSDSAMLLESAREFEAEVSLLSQLDHPGIVRLDDFFFEAGRVYVVLEYIQGQSLRNKVQQDGPLPEAEVKRIGSELCSVLEYLHSGNPPIVHRDVTPENILIQPDGKVTLIDFSLAVKQDGRATTDSCAKQCFTPPEQFREEACPQSDIYALGATLFFLLTGQTPKPISCSSPQKKAPDISDEINAIVEHATKLDLNQRYESVHWMKLDLDKRD